MFHICFQMQGIKGESHKYIAEDMKNTWSEKCITNKKKYLDTFHQWSSSYIGCCSKSDVLVVAQRPLNIEEDLFLFFLNIVP